MSLVSTSAPWRSLLANRDLRLLLAAGLVSQTGDWMLATGIGFQVYALTGSTLASAAALFATQLPQMLIGSFAGVVVDRSDARRVIVAANLVLAVVLIPLFAVSDASRIWIVIAVVAASSCLTPFSVAAQMALLPALVDDDLRVTANAANAQVQNVARLLGAALGGVIIAVGGLGWLAAVDMASFLLAAGCIAAIRRRPQVRRSTRTRLLSDWVGGVRAVRRSRVLLVIAVFFGVTGLGEAFMGTLFAPFVSSVLGGSAGAFGAINAAQAVGGIVGGLLVTTHGHRFAPRTLFGWGAVAFGTGDLALFLYPLVSQQVWPAMVIIALVGVPGAALFAGMLTLFQADTDDQNRGRVYGLLSTVQNAIMLLSTVVAGLLAGPLGIVAVISVQGAVYLLVGVMVLLALRSSASTGVRTAENERDPMEPTLTFDNPATATMLPNMALASNVRTSTVSDPLALRALAHPLRVRLHSLVAREGSLTAADAARQLDISHALASHHLRQLAKYGFIEPAEPGDRKERPWRITSTNLFLKPEGPEAQASADLLDRYTVDRAAERLADWQHRREDSGAWAELPPVRESILYLSPEEFAELLAVWERATLALASERPIGHADRRPADAIPVSLTLVSVPLEPTERGG